MRITIYKRYNNYMAHSFLPEALDNVKEFCYNNNIKYYVLSYSDKEMIEYERLSKRYN